MSPAMNRAIVRKIEGIRRFGLRRSIRIEVDRIILRALALKFKFHPWHAEAPISARPYRCVVARIVNELKPVSVVEVGCGLGMILRLVEAPKRYGYDVDVGAIRAARFLHGDTITFSTGDLATVDLKEIDVLILVNWIHEISPMLLHEQLRPLLSRTRYLLLDALDPDGPTGYRFKHDFKFLDRSCRRLSVTCPPNEGRSFHLFEVHA